MIQIQLIIDKNWMIQTKYLRKIQIERYLSYSIVYTHINAIPSLYRCSLFHTYKYNSTINSNNVQNHNFLIQNPKTKKGCTRYTILKLNVSQLVEIEISNLFFIHPY